MKNNLTPLDKLSLVTDELADQLFYSPTYSSDEISGRLTIYPEDIVRDIINSNREYIESVNNRISMCEWEEALELLNDELYTRINQTQEYLD